MIKKLFRRNSKTTVAPASVQHQLDTLRYENADNQLMQLHCDRMQSLLDAQQS